MDMLLTLFGKIADVDSATMTLLVMISCVATMAVRNHMVLPGLAILILPLILGLSLAANFVFLSFEVFLQNKIDQWVMGVVAAGTAGAIGGIGLTAILGHLLNRNKPHHA